MSRATMTVSASPGISAPEEGAPVVRGTDFGVVSADTRLAAITGFFDHVRPV